MVIKFWRFQKGFGYIVISLLLAPERPWQWQFPRLFYFLALASAQNDTWKFYFVNHESPWGKRVISKCFAVLLVSVWLWNFFNKVQLFWEGLSKRQNHKADCANICGLLRKAELYPKWHFLNNVLGMSSGDFLIWRNFEFWSTNICFLFF